MSELEVVGQVVGGNEGSILIREKNERRLELGDLLIVDDIDNQVILLQVFNLHYGSQIPQINRELASGIQLEGYGTGITDFIDPALRNYTLAEVKAIAKINNKEAKIPKTLPAFFSKVRYANNNDLAFLTKQEKAPIYIGNVRSGSKVLEDSPVYLNGNDFFTHHVLVPAATGRGKSNLIKVMLWSILEQGKFGVLVLDSHDEYYGRNNLGLKDHHNAQNNMTYYSIDAIPGSPTLVISLKKITPYHFDGILNFTPAQKEATELYYREFGENWIEIILLGEIVKSPDGHPIDSIKLVTIQVLQRKIGNILNISVKNNQLIFNDHVFSRDSGGSTVKNIVSYLEDGKIIIIDTSRLGTDTELLIGSIIANELFYIYSSSKSKGELESKIPASIIIEEAPRVLAAEKIEQGDNIYSKIAREGRKFKVGLIAITQLTSIIPRMLLTNMNTKIILGNEMSTERRAIIESAAQDLTTEDRTIASLDKGEAIISSIFSKFAIPIYTPLFEEFIKKKKKVNQDHNLIL